LVVRLRKGAKTVVTASGAQSELNKANNHASIRAR
jgi:hypothetical protein